MNGLLKNLESMLEVLNDFMNESERLIVLVGIGVEKNLKEKSVASCI